MSAVLAQSQAALTPAPSIRQIGGLLQRACACGDSAMVARANGVGPKLASRIVNELKDKAGALPSAPGVAAAAAPAGSASADAVSVLQNLGFKPAVASAAVAHAVGELGDGAGLNDLVRVALKRAASEMWVWLPMPEWPTEIALGFALASATRSFRFFQRESLFTAITTDSTRTRATASKAL